MRKNTVFYVLAVNACVVTFATRRTFGFVSSRAMTVGASVCFYLCVGLNGVGKTARAWGRLAEKEGQGTQPYLKARCG